MTPEATVRGTHRMILAALLAAGAPACIARAQILEDAKAPPEPKAAFSDVLCFAVPQSLQTRLDVFTQVGYESLSFVKEEDHYGATYDMTISIYDSADALVREKSWSERVRAATFDESVSSTSYSLTERVFPVAPGRYRIVSLIHDDESKATTRLSRQVIAPDFSRASFSMSTPMFLNRLSVHEGKTSMAPNVSANVGSLPDSFFVFVEAYNRLDVDSMLYHTTIFDGRGDSVFAADTVQGVRDGRNEVFLRVNEPRLTLGDYQIVIRATPVRHAAAVPPGPVAVTGRSFSSRWRGMPRDVKNLDVAIDQLQYIAKDSELAYLRAAKTMQEKQDRFLAFWSKRSSNRYSPRNVKMEQYYARVEYANRHFSRFRIGWKTDMGMVYIIFGAPGNVERHPFESDSKPYEVWNYYDLNFQFIFVDEVGTGDYRLTTPIWDYWQRPQE